VPTEIELKLALDPTAASALVRHPAVQALRRGRTRTERVASSYYDTADSLLAHAGVALRVRRIGKRWVQTIKGPPESDAGAGLHARAEFEWPLSRSALDLTPLSATPWRKLIDKAARRGRLVRCFTTDVERRTIPLRFADGTLAELCLDQGRITALRDGRTRRVPIAEIEIELESGAAANLFGLALQLAADLPVRVLTASKAERGHALLRGERDIVGAPVKARSVALTGDATTSGALSTLVRECLQQIAANAPGLLEDNDPEWVHQMRIGTRRLRSCLSLVRPYASSAALDDVLAETKWLADVLGSARDWDVFVRETLPPLAAGVAQDAATSAGLKRLCARAEARRRVARAAAKSAAGSARFQRLLLSGGLLCATPRFGTDSPAAGSEHADVLGGRADTFAAALLARRQRKLDQHAATLAHASPEERHAARIAAKRLRYVAEFFAPVFPKKRGKAYLKTLAALQDVLGRMNDAATALRLATESGGAKDGSAAGAVRGWVAAHAAALEPDLASVSRRFAGAKPFWIRN
jgi:inorganic triphosphatase YgiF